MITSEEQRHIFEMALQPGWDIVLREVMDKVNTTAQDALATLCPEKNSDERLFKGGQHQGVFDIFEYLKRMEKDAHSYVTSGDKESRRPLKVK